MKTAQLLILILILITSSIHKGMAQNDSLAEKKFVVVEIMPVFPGCETESNERAKKSCTEKKLLQYVYKNIKYPETALKNSIEGIVLVSFTVNEEGKLEQIECVKDIGGDCGAEIVRVMESMNEKNMVWTPGTQRGKAVKVKYNMPARFRLPSSKTKPKKRKWWQRKKN